MALDQIDIDRLDLETNREKEMSFIEHLEELRWTIVRALIGVIICTILVFLFKRFFIDFILFGPTSSDFVGYHFICSISEQVFRTDTLCFGNDLVIQNMKLQGQFVSHFQISFIMGFILAFPWVLWQFWLFVKPALHTQEVNSLRGLTFFAWLFFIIGNLFGYFIILPLSLNFFENYNLTTESSLKNIYQLQFYISYITMSTLSAGIMFELPIFIFILAKLGVVGPQSLRDYRKHAFIIILILSAVITPPDIWSQFLITIPVYLLYEMSIFVASFVVKANKKS